MKVHETHCDLCKSKAPGEVASLSVPKGWVPPAQVQIKHTVPDSDKYFFLSSVFGGDRERTPSFDICRSCTEALLQTALWMKGVFDEAH